MAETPWLDLPYRSLSKENIRAEAARRGLTFRKLMALYYRQDRERAVHLSLCWCVDREHPKRLFGKARVDQFVGVRSLSVSLFIEKELCKQLRM